MIKIFFIYVLTLLFKNYCIYYNKNISLNKFKDCIGTNLSDNDVFSFVNTPENIEESTLKLRFISVLSRIFSRENVFPSDHSDVYCVNNIDNTKINPLIYFEIINM